MTPPMKQEGSGMLELAARCEQATGPDHLFDAEIAKAVGWLEILAFGFSWQGPYGQFCNDCPRYTASLDAAMTLVPEGWSWTVSSNASAGVYLEGPPYSGFEADAATAALALTAAFLRARASRDAGQ